MYSDETIRHYLEAASSGTPTPGGGSVAALAAAAGMSMACMAANFTVGRKKFAHVQEEVADCLARCVRDRDELLRLVDKDAEAYAALSAAYAMPKDSPEQKTARRKAIQQALTQAMQPPMEIVRLCGQAMQTICRLGEIANPNLISDVGVAAILVEAALRAARLNVEINLRELDDKAPAAEAAGEIENSSRKAGELLLRVKRMVDAALKAGA